MKLLVFVAFFTLASATPIPIDKKPSDGWFVPKVDGSFFWMTRKQFENEYNFTSERKTVVVEYFLYTKANSTSPEQLFLDDSDSLARSNFNKDHPTRIIIHGWQNNLNSEINVEIRKALMEVGNFNVISVDWSSSAGSINYATSKKAVATVGQNVASFIDFLHSSAEMSFKKLTLVGHSLGAHVCGYAGKYVTSGRVEIITGLDPAWPLFDYSNCDTRLCNTDAEFVDTIQTNGDLLGFLKPIGKAAYYPNGGKSQPGCGLDLAGSCSHKRSYLYYAEAVLENSFLSVKCKDYEEAVAKKCDKYFNNGRMGSIGSIFNSGSYYVPVNKKPLYGTG